MAMQQAAAAVEHALWSEWWTLFAESDYKVRRKYRVVWVMLTEQCQHASLENYAPSIARRWPDLFKRFVWDTEVACVASAGQSASSA